MTPDTTVGAEERLEAAFKRGREAAAGIRESREKREAAIRAPVEAERDALRVALAKVVADGWYDEYRNLAYGTCHWCGEAAYGHTGVDAECEHHASCLVHEFRGLLPPEEQASG